VKPDDAASFQAPAELYDAYVGRYGAQLAAALIDVAALAPGDHVLDVGCGPGPLTRAVAARVGAGSVAAVDPSEPFAAACRDRVPGADVRVARAEDLPFADETFDAVVSQLVINFVGDPDKGVAEMRRVTRPGGTVAASVWDYAEGMTLIRRFWDAAIELDPERAAPLDEGVRMAHCDEGGLARLFAAAGLEEVRGGSFIAHADYASLDDLWRPIGLGVGPTGAYATALPEDRRAALRDALGRHLGQGEAPFTLGARAWWAAGRCPLHSANP
jgi:SAM-dependent methyltransferase